MFSFTTIAIATIVVVIFYWLKNKKGNRFPPGPIPLPIIGNLLSLDTKMYLTFEKWSKQYGPIIGFQMGSQKAVVITDYKLIKEALNDNTFNGRPDVDLFTASGKYGVSPSDGIPWVEQRRFTLRNLRDFGFGKSSMETLVMEEVFSLLDFLKKNEGKLMNLRSRLSITMINALWHILTGQRFDPDDKELHKIYEGMSRLANSNFLRIVFPKFTKTFPNLTGYTEFVKLVDEFHEIPNRAIKDHQLNPAEEGQPRDFIDVFFNEIDKTTDPNSSFYKETGRKHLLHGITDLFGAGTVTTSETILWTILYFIRHPEVQQKFQAEIDNVIGKERLPTLTDKPSMPYTEALINEVLRYSSLAPLALLHSTTEDVEFHGYKIPKGTFIIPNLYSVHKDKNIWGDPENFRPERFLSPTDNKKVLKNEALVAFSTGKRMCIGENLARDELFLFLTSIFQKFNLLPDPENLKPTMEPAVGFISMSQPFNVIIKERV